LKMICFQTFFFVHPALHKEKIQTGKEVIE
jgi:hypothetical protein